MPPRKPPVTPEVPSIPQDEAPPLPSDEVEDMEAEEEPDEEEECVPELAKTKSLEERLGFQKKMEQIMEATKVRMEHFMINIRRGVISFTGTTRSFFV